MSIDKINTTEWIYTFPMGEYNYDIEIKATKDGLEFDYDSLSWDEISEARKTITEEKP